MESQRDDPRATILVIGASGALGNAVCECLAGDDFDLILAYRSNREAAEALGNGLSGRVRVRTTRIDLLDHESISEAIARQVRDGTRLKGLVFACGADIPQPRVADTAPDQWRWVIETELLGFAELSRLLIPVLRAQGGGSIVGIVTFANYRYQIGDALSSVPKAGVESLIRSIALEEGRHGIRANCVAPGIINAGLGAQFQRKLYSPETWERVRKGVPMRRFGEAFEVAQAVGFLISERASYVTGNTLIVDGGMHL